MIKSVTQFVSDDLMMTVTVMTQMRDDDNEIMSELGGESKRDDKMMILTERSLTMI